MSLIERMARAIATQHGFNPDLEVHAAPPFQVGGRTFALATGPIGPLWHHFCDDARAALEAMLEPTEAMLDAAWSKQKVEISLGGLTESGRLYPESAQKVWRAMIQAEFDAA